MCSFGLVWRMYWLARVLPKLFLGFTYFVLFLFYILCSVLLRLTALSFLFHLCKRPNIPDVTDTSLSEGGYGKKICM